jgi:hypothetical protein
LVDVKQVKNLQKKGWNFDWTVPYKDGFEVYQYRKQFGAILVNPRLRIMAIEEKAAQKLVKKYFAE